MVEHIVQLLIQERDRLDRAIAALGGSVGKKRGRPFGSTNKPVASALDVRGDKMPEHANRTAPVKRKMSAAGRQRIADAARRRWALIKAGKAKSPFAKKAGKRKS